MHCHIARHASGGLAIQILERQADAAKLVPANGAAMKEVNRVCKNWKQWQGNCANWWRGCDPHYAFQDDSGI